MSLTLRSSECGSHQSKWHIHARIAHLDPLGDSSMKLFLLFFLVSFCTVWADPLDPKVLGKREWSLNLDIWEQGKASLGGTPAVTLLDDGLFHIRHDDDGPILEFSPEATAAILDATCNFFKALSLDAAPPGKTFDREEDDGLRVTIEFSSGGYSVGFDTKRVPPAAISAELVALVRVIWAADKRVQEAFTKAYGSRLPLFFR